ncbi:MAG: type II toxin-antitoxin system VapC family toxin [Kiloniellales bacterium]
MSFLIDTNVVSETRKRVPDAQVLAWLQQVDQKDLFISVLTIGELTKGVAKRGHTDPRAAAALEHWVRGIERLFSDHVIPIDSEIAAAWGRLDADTPLPVVDALLAATAKVHGLVLVTRNVKDFEQTQVRTINPWVSDASSPMNGNL